MTGNTVTDSDNVVISSEPSNMAVTLIVRWSKYPGRIFGVLTCLNVQQADNLPKAGLMYCLRKPSGSMPMQVRPRHNFGEKRLLMTMQTT